MSRKLTGTLEHVPLNRGGYDRGGEYYGTGQRLYRYAPDQECGRARYKLMYVRGRYEQIKKGGPCPCSSKYFEFRASGRKDAIAKLKAKCKHVRVRGGR